MATNARFKIDIYGDTANFDNSLKGINSAMSNLKGEASQLRKELRLDPTNVKAMEKLQANLAQQLENTKMKASSLKQEMSNIDKSTPGGQKRWLTLQKQLSENSLKANALEGDIKEVGQAIERGNWKADIDVSQAEGSINRVKKGFIDLKEIGIGALRQIGSSAVSALGNGLRGWVSGAMDTQKAMIALQNTMKFKGVGGDFQKLSNDMSKLATDTNANTEDTLKLATTFVGLGDSAGTASKKTSALVKANQAFGGSGENLKGVAQAYSQMAASGKVSAENIGQLTDNNTALGASLKDTIMQMNPSLKQYGSFNDAVSSGAVSIDMLDKAMQKMADGSGGGVKTIGDAWDSFNETMQQALLPTLNALTPVITALIGKISGWGESSGKAVQNVVKYVQDLWKALEKNGALSSFSKIWDGLKSTFSSVISIIGQLIESFTGVNSKTAESSGSVENVSKTIANLAKGLADIIKKIADFAKKFSESKTALDITKSSLVALSAGFLAFKIGSGIVTAIDAFKKLQTAIKEGTGVMKAFNVVASLNPYILIATAIVAVVAGLVYFFTQTKTGKKVWADFVDFLKSAWDSVVSFFSGIGQWFSDIWNRAVDGAKGIWQGLVDWFTGIVTGIQDAWSGVKEFFTGLWNGIVEVVQTVFDTVSSIITGAYNWFVTTFQPLISFFQSIFDLIGSIINLVFQVVIGIAKTAYNLIIGAWQGLSAWFGGIFDAVSSIVQTVFNAIIGFGKWAWNGIVSVWNAVSGFFSGIFNAVSSVVSGVFNAIGSFASSAWSSVSSAFSPVIGFFSNIFNSAKKAVSGALDALGGIASNSFNAVTGAFKGIVGFFSDIFGSVKKVVDNVLGGITHTIDNITGAVNGVSSKVKKFFGGSMVAEMRTVNLGASGIMLNSASAGTTNTTNTFNIQAGQMNTTALARAIKREIDNGRA